MVAIVELEFVWLVAAFVTLLVASGVCSKVGSVLDARLGLNVVSSVGSEEIAEFENGVLVVAKVGETEFEEFVWFEVGSTESLLLVGTEV